MNMMRLTKVFTGCAAFGLAFGAAGLLLSAPARAGDDDVSIDQKFMRSIMDGLGLKRDGEATINYRERAPLVLPPSRDLPPPDRSDAVTANPAWPKDPDVARRKAEAAMERDRNVSDERELEQNPLRLDQLTPGGRAKDKKKQASSDNGYQAPASGFGSQIMPSELGYKGNLFGTMFGSKKEETEKFTGEPPRALLTDPPPGYQTPSPDQPYGVGKAAAQKPADDYTTRGELKN